MKKSSFLLFVILLWFGKSVLAQADFAPVGATWYYGHDRDLDFKKGYRLQRSVGDTVVLGQSCRRIETMLVRRDTYNPAGPVDTVYNPDAYFVYANSDTVFYYHEYAGRFVPLYIFNVNIGDTITYFQGMPLSQDSTFKTVVTGITTDTVDGHPLRTVHAGFNGGYTERLGYFDGLDWYLYTFTGDWLETRIRCYSDSVINYVRQPGIVCNSIPGANTIEKQEEYDGISIYPNPAVDHIVIKTLNPQNEIHDVVLYDIAGRKVFRETGKSAHTVNINTGSFAQGAYLLQVKTKQGNVVKKIDIL